LTKGGKEWAYQGLNHKGEREWVTSTWERGRALYTSPGEENEKEGHHDRRSLSEKRESKKGESSAYRRGGGGRT